MVEEVQVDDQPPVPAAEVGALDRIQRIPAGDRFGDLELNTYPAGGSAVITGDLRAEARRRTGRICAQTGTELTAGKILDSPHMFIGTIKDLTLKFIDLRERLASAPFSSTTSTHRHQ